MNTPTQLDALLQEIAQLTLENARLRDAAVQETNSRLMAEEALDRTEDRLQLALDAAGLAMWEWDLQTQAVYTSRRFGEMVQDPGHPHGEGQVWRLQDLQSKYYAEDRRHLDHALVRVFKQVDSRLDVEIRVRTPSGPRWLECTGEVTQRDMMGAALRMVGIVRDITRRRTVQQEAEAARAQAVAANSAKDDFLAHISHEIRTPLNGVIGMNNLLAQTELTPDQRQYVDLVASSGRALLALVNDVLDYSRLQAQKLILEQVRFPLNRWLWEVVTPMRVTAEGKGLELNLTSSPDLPEEVVGDPGRLRQVVTNLVANAIKFTEQGAISVSMHPAPGFAGRVGLCIEVRDTGIGIPPDRQQSVFGAFVQADRSTSRRYGGTGLGLSICLKLAQMMGGRIDLDSAPGRGSCFSFVVPLELPRAEHPNTVFGSEDLSEDSSPDRTDADPSQNREEVEALVPPSRFPGKRALVVDDHSVNRLLATKLLEQLEFEVAAAENGEKAVQMIRFSRFDLVLMDIQMPIMNGWQATHHIRQWEQSRQRTRMPIIALSAHASAADREHALASGMDGYLSKPLTPEALQAALRATRLAFKVTEPGSSSRGWDKQEGETVIDSTIDITHSEPAPGPPSRLSLHHRQRILNRMAGNEAALKQVAEAFCADLRRCMGLAYTSIKSQDYAVVEAQAHALTGLLSGITADHAASLARNLEHAARRKDPAGITRGFTALSEAAKDAYDVVRTW
ncbi:MAG: hypothetical protein RLZZ126_225 [Pseudomonadota bacterium]|jgi:signal transduction histidine kinase/CheY-like chemotaxis protein